MKSISSLDRISSYAAILALSEMGLGGFLHALKVPFTGTILCANQIFLLSKASLEGAAKWETGSISVIGALLKSLSPIGKKITPMIALFMQGALYNVALLLFGNNVIGRLAGALLAMLWSILQPLFFYYILYGNLFLETMIAGSRELSKSLHLADNSFLYAFGALTAIKLFLGVSAVYAASRISAQAMERYLKKIARPLQNRPPASKIKHPIYWAIQDLFKPLFLISASATGLFLFWKEMEYGTLIEHLLRTFGLGFLCFFALRSIPLHYLLKGSSLFQGAWEKTLNRMQEPPLRDLPSEALPNGDESHSAQT